MDTVASHKILAKIPAHSSAGIRLSSCLQSRRLNQTELSKPFSRKDWINTIYMYVLTISPPNQSTYLASGRIVIVIDWMLKYWQVYREHDGYQ
jgi:hypothetical protein